MSTLYRLKFLDASITWWVVLALYGLASGCSSNGPTELGDASREPQLTAGTLANNRLAAEE